MIIFNSVQHVHEHHKHDFSFINQSLHIILCESHIILCQLPSFHHSMYGPILIPPKIEGGDFMSGAVGFGGGGFALLIVLFILLIIIGCSCWGGVY